MINANYLVYAYLHNQALDHNSFSDSFPNQTFEDVYNSVTPFFEEEFSNRGISFTAPSLTEAQINIMKH